MKEDVNPFQRSSSKAKKPNEIKAVAMIHGNCKPVFFTEDASLRRCARNKIEYATAVKNTTSTAK